MIWGFVIVAVLAAAAGADRWIRRHRRAAAPVPPPRRERTSERELPQAAARAMDTEAYAAAPPIEEEVLALLRWQEIEQSPAGPASPEEYRVHLLRWAALQDRLTIEPGPSTAGQREALHSAAVRAAWELQQHDHVHGTAAGPHSPCSLEWEPCGGGRAYVRQEYAAWLATSRPRT